MAMIEAGLRLIRAVGANSRRLRRTKRISFDILACDRGESTSSALAGPVSEETAGESSSCGCSSAAGADELPVSLLPSARKNATGANSLLPEPMSWTLPVSGAASISNNVKRKTEALVHELQSNRTNMGPTKPANCVVILMAALGPGAATGFPCQPRTGADNILVVGATGIEPGKQMTWQAWNALGRNGVYWQTKCPLTGLPVAPVLGKRCGVSRSLNKATRRRCGFVDAKRDRTVRSAFSGSRCPRRPAAP